MQGASPEGAVHGAWRSSRCRPRTSGRPGPDAYAARVRRPLLVLLVLLALLLPGLGAGCGGDDAPDAAPTSGSTTTATEPADDDDVFAYDASAPLRYRDL